MRKIKNKNKKRCLVLICCLVLVLGIVVYFIVNLIGSRGLSNNQGSNNSITLNEKDIYKYDDVKIFKGENPDNYLYFSNILWRIISINKDCSLDITTENNINILKNVNYDVNKYVNDIFLNSIDKKYLDKVSYCNDVISKVEKRECKKIYTKDYVRLLSIEDIVNSADNDKSYLLSDLDYWLNNKSNSKSFVVVNNKIASGDSKDGYGVRPVIRLKCSITIKSGDGTLDKPYIVSEDTTGLSVGSYIKLDNDLWVIYETGKDNVKLALADALTGAKAFGNSSEYNIDKDDNIAHYLNNDYLNSLSYKDMLIDSKWETGKYTDSYNSVDKNVVTAKVGMLSVKDLKGYYLITPSDEEEVYFYNTNSYVSKTNYLRSVVPTISIKNNYKVNGMGTEDNPFEVEV